VFQRNRKQGDASVLGMKYYAVSGVAGGIYLPPEFLRRHGYDKPTNAAQAPS
jgi:hypothetical protein